MAWILIPAAEGSTSLRRPFSTTRQSQGCFMLPSGQTKTFDFLRSFRALEIPKYNAACTSALWPNNTGAEEALSYTWDLGIEYSVGLNHARSRHRLKEHLLVFVQSSRPGLRQRDMPIW